MFYYKSIDENGNFVSLESRNMKASTNEKFIEITEAEYNSLLAVLEEKWKEEQKKLQEEQEKWKKENVTPEEFTKMVERVL